MPDTMAKGPGLVTHKTAAGAAEPDARLADESFAIHLRYGGEYMDENPIAGRPGEFHLSSTGRKDKLAVPQAGKKPSAPATPSTSAKPTPSPLPKDTKADKSPKPGTTPKPKRRKSKGVATATPS